MIDVNTLDDLLYDLINPLIQPASIQTMTFSADLIAGNKINGKVDGLDITEILFDTDNSTTLGLLAVELLTFKAIKAAVVSGNIITITSMQSHKAALTTFAVTEGATQATIAIAETVIQIPLIWRDQGKPQPKPPYVTMKKISGVNQIGFDELEDTGGGNFTSKGDRAFTLGVQALGNNSFTILSRLQDNLNIPDIVDAFTAAKIAVYNNPSIVDIAALVATDFESRHGIDLMMYTITETETNIGTIESAGISGELTKEDDTTLTVPEFIVSV